MADADRAGHTSTPDPRTDSAARECGSEETALLLVRHGDIARDREDEPRLIGWTDVHLSPGGEREADLLARRLAAADPPCAVYSSPLRRAQRTAETIAAHWGTEVRLESDLREIYCGEVEGLPTWVVKDRYPLHWAANFRHDDPDFRWPRGESYRELRVRAVRTVHRIAARHPGSRIVAVTHAGFVSQVVSWIHGTSAARWDLCRPSNGSITELRFGRGRARLVSFDENTHLLSRPAE